jgi:YggT family protein
MFVISHFLSALATILDLILSLYMWLIIIRAVLSWVTFFRLHPLVYALNHSLSRLTEPVLWRIRRILPLQGGGLDLSPFIAVLAILFLKYFLVATLYDIARRL